MDNKAIAEQLVKRCLAKGADAAEVYIESGRNLSLDVRKGDIETVQEAAAAGAGIRVFVQGRMAFASSNDLGEKALEEAAGRAIAFAKATTADPNNVLPGDKGVTEVAGLYDPRIAQVPMEEKIELAKRLEALALKDPRVTKSDGASYRESEGEVVIANSNGLVKGYKSSGCGVGDLGRSREGRAEVLGRRFLQPPLLRRPQAGRGDRCQGRPRGRRDARSADGQDPAGPGHLPRRHRPGPARGHPGRGQRRARPAGGQLPGQEAGPDRSPRIR